MKTLIVSLFFLIVAACLFAQTTLKKKEVTVISGVEGVEIFVTLQYKGVNYVLFVPGKKGREDTIKTLAHNEYRQATRGEIDMLKSLGRDIAVRALAGRVVVATHDESLRKLSP